MSWQTFDTTAFEAAHRQFIRGVQHHGPGPFNGFDDVRLREHELDYKHEVRGTATRLLQLGKWDGWVGSSPGRIFDAALAACSTKVSKNLMEVSKGDRGNSAAPLFLAAKEGTRATRATLGLALHHFFRGGGAEPAEVRPRFESLRETVVSLGLPNNWPWYAYLAWLMSPDRYAPVRPRTFDRALRWFGSDLKMSWNVTWEPYADYTALIAWVRDRLRPIYGPVDLIGAHSFLFVAFYYEGESNPLWYPGTSVSKETGPELDFEAELAKRIEDAERRERIGFDGELIVAEAERRRLRAAGREDLAGDVRLVSADRSSVGYDVVSFEVDGAERHIEVKSTASAKSGSDRFYLTENERSVAERDPAWRVFRVYDAGGRPDIEDLGNGVSSETWALTPDTWAVRVNG